MNDKKIIIILIFATILIVFSGILVLNKPPVDIKASSNAKIATQNNVYDWGEIKYEGPKATKSFKIKNSGTDILKLYNVKTSCACTSAQIKTEKELSPLFGMHSSSSWTGEVLPGKEAELTVVFDQQFHGPSGVGPVERIITLQTNDASQPKLEFNLKGKVVK